MRTQMEVYLANSYGFCNWHKTILLKGM